MESLLKMLKINNAPTVPLADEETTNDVDEPPDDRVSELKANFKKEDTYKSSTIPNLPRRESLLTRAFKSDHDTSPTSPRFSEVPRGLSTTSSHSFASTAELTSDVESPIRSATPSPPPPLHGLRLTTSNKAIDPATVVIAPITKEDKPVVAENGEAAVEKTLGRKRCIMFACRETSTASQKESVTAKPAEAPKPAPRKCMISFACPTRPAKEDQDQKASADLNKPRPGLQQFKLESKPSAPPLALANQEKERPVPSPLSPQQSFHEFGSPSNDTDDWVEKAGQVSKPKLTIDDCLKKENAIRKLGEEVEEEAEEEEREQDELDNELDEDEDEVEDDFAPSDDDNSSDGNESDDEGGFADSDDESDAGSDYQFWRPSTTVDGLAVPDNMQYFSARQHSRSRASSTSSAHSADNLEMPRRNVSKVRVTRPIRMRPGTPELPDSTDFVCGTLDEDRPLEAAYISCREQRRRLKHVPIPQDIDPSFPTTDPEDEEDEEEEQDVADSSDHAWMKHQFEGFDDDVRGRRPSAVRVSPLLSPTPVVAPPRPVRPQPTVRPTLRSPPPKHKSHRSPPPLKQRLSKSPAPRRLFDQAPRRFPSPPPAGGLRSPRGSPTGVKFTPLGITINHLAQRPQGDMTSSLPHTPNPYFRNWRNIQQQPSRIAAAAVPSGPEPNKELHVRGPVDIVIGLEKKRQKRKEKFWRQHCRKAAKEHAEKRPPPGRGAERMKELGLECAERNRGYGLGQQAQHILSL